jgi:hypothetical protein
MIAAIMQPYFFPYIGYFQLMHAVDTFVLYDDVQYINRGWINRNLIVSDGGVQWLTMPVSKAPREWLINQRRYLNETGARARLIQKLRRTYGATEFFDDIFPVLESLIKYADCNVARHNANSLICVARKLGIDCRIMSSSEIEKPNDLKGAAKIIEICQRIGADGYVNAIGGRTLYDTDDFRHQGIQLSFLQTQITPEPLPVGPQYLSIIDSLMRHGPAACEQSLSNYTLVSNDVS